MNGDRYHITEVNLADNEHADDLDTYIWGRVTLYTVRDKATGGSFSEGAVVHETDDWLNAFDFCQKLNTQERRRRRERW